jgi:hypothetical protein
VSGQQHAPGRTLPQGKTRYSFYRRLGGPQGRSGRAKNLVPTGFRSRTVQPVVSRYTNLATSRPNTYCFSTAKLVTRTRLNVTLCVHCLYFAVYSLILRVYVYVQFDMHVIYVVIRKLVNFKQPGQKNTRRELKQRIPANAVTSVIQPVWFHSLLSCRRTLH